MSDQTTYISVPIETNPDALAQLAFVNLQSRFPDWTPSDAQLATWVISSIALIGAELRDVASDVPAGIFRYFGKSLLNLPPIDAAPATVNVTVTMKDNVGYTLAAGSLVAGLRDANGTLRGFVNHLDIVIPPGATATTAGAVPLTALEEGVEASGLGNNGSVLELVTSLERVASVVATVTSSGGTDPETDDQYLIRLAADLQLQAPRPILPRDFAIFAKNIAGVGRALALDGYDAVAVTNNNARTITVAVADANGLAVASPVKTAVQAYLQASREVNFLVYVIDPTYTTIDTQYNVTMWPGYTDVQVRANISTALANYINPKRWGRPPFGPVDEWLQSATVKVNDVMVAIGNADGVKDVNTVQIRTGANAYAYADIALTGPAPLPLAGVTNNGTIL